MNNYDVFGFKASFCTRKQPKHTTFYNPSFLGRIPYPRIPAKFHILCKHSKFSLLANSVFITWSIGRPENSLVSMSSNWSIYCKCKYTVLLACSIRHWVKLMHRYPFTVSVIKLLRSKHETTKIKMFKCRKFVPIALIGKGNHF